MGKSTKRFKEYIEEGEYLRRKKLKKESRHNYKEHLKDVIDHQDWDELAEELYYESHSNYSR
jgi:hypothetical protein